MINVHAVNKNKKIKKVHRFLCAHCKQKINKKVHRFLRARCKQKKAKKINKKNKDSINQSPQLLISSDSYSLHGIYSHIHHIMPKRFFLSFYSLVFF